MAEKGAISITAKQGSYIVGCVNWAGAILSPLPLEPVMEGKSVLMLKFAGVNSIDLCVDTADPDEFINCVKYLSPSFAGVNLEDIKGPDCFYVEEKLKELMDIPVFHDDQHGTAIVCLAGLINAMELQEKKIEDIKVVINGAGAAGIACMKLIQNYGLQSETILTQLMLQMLLDQNLFKDHLKKLTLPLRRSITDITSTTNNCCSHSCKALLLELSILRSM
jgi:malate dehydrogenase (oxaloacetate-decarboxylating)(NADP+)